MSTEGKRNGQVAAAGRHLLEDMLGILRTSGGADLLLEPGLPPRIIQHRGLQALDAASLTAADVRRLVDTALGPALMRRLEERGEAVAAIDSLVHGRFRVRARRSGRQIQAEVRAILRAIPGPEVMSLRAPYLDELVRPDSGLVVVAGASGSGRSTTIALLLERIAARGNRRIFTVEQPVEFVLASDQSWLTQREVEADDGSFEAAVEEAGLNAPAVVLLGPLERRGACQAALDLIDAGSLVIATLEVSPSVIAVRHRLPELFPNERRERVLRRITPRLHAIWCQTLVETASRRGLLAAVECAWGFRIRPAFESGTDTDVYHAMQTGGDKFSCQILNSSLVALWLEGRVSLDVAKGASNDSAELEAMASRTRGLLSPRSRPR